MSAAVTSLGPIALIRTLFVFSPLSLIASFLRFRMISVTSSFTPGIVENSWRMPSILTDVTATPGSELRRILLRLFPSVVPYHLSRGSTTNFP